MTKRIIAAGCALALCIIGVLALTLRGGGKHSAALPYAGHMCQDRRDVTASSESEQRKLYTEGANYGYCNELLPRVAPTDDTKIPHNSVVFFSPHQDDEAISYGAEILQMTGQGKPVYVVLMGLGDKAPGCKPLNLTPTACTEQRDREFTTSVRRMHAIPVILKTRFHDNEADASKVLPLMQPWVAAGNEAHTMTQYDTHPDHSNMGYALAELHGARSHWHVKDTDEFSTKPVPFLACWQNASISTVTYTGSADWKSVLRTYTDPGRVGGYSAKYFEILAKHNSYWSREYSDGPTKTADGAKRGCSTSNWWNDQPRKKWLVAS